MPGVFLIGSEHSPQHRTTAVGVELSAELEVTRAAFHELLHSVTDLQWRRRSRNLAWKIGEVLFHMTLALRFLPADVRLIRKGGITPRLPASLFNWLNVEYTHLGTWNLTREAVAERYDTVYQRVLRLLATIGENEWDRGMDYPDWEPLLSGTVTLERPFHFAALHFASHAAQIRAGLDDTQGGELTHGL